jgi:arylsulfatase A
MQSLRSLSIIGLFCTCLTVIAFNAASASAADKPLPNILILYADDMGYGDLGCNNPKSKIPTPHLDRLATQGARFTDGHSSSGICTPSRYALLTGRHHWRDFHGITNSFGPSVFKPDQLTMPAMLKSRGYATAAIGKWHLGWDWDAIRKDKGNQPEHFDWTKAIPGGPTKVGFDRYFGDDVINFPPYAFIENDRVTQIPTVMKDEKQWKPIKEGNWECRPGPMVAGWDPYQVLPTLTQRGVEYLDSRKGQSEPFFLYFAFPCPHAPIIPNDEFDGKSQAGPFGDFVAQTDDIVGKLLAALERAGLSENTIVVFTADNGPEHYAYERDAKFQHWSAAPFRGLKRDLYEGGHHVPFLVRWPGVIKPGTTSKALVSQVDLLATFAAVMDYTLPDSAAVDSHNMLPYLRGEAERVREACVQNTNANGYALRQGDWLLIQAKDGYVTARNKAWESRHDYPADDQNPVELYNLAEDIEQKKNLAAAQPERVASMVAALQEIRAGRGTRPRLDKPAKAASQE